VKRSDLRPYQERVAGFIASHPFCAAWVDMGLGKTVSTLTAYADLREQFDARRVLVVGPLRVARKVWPDEIAEWDHVSGLSVSRIIGSEKQRWAGLTTPADVHVINREQVDWLADQFIADKKQFRRFPWDMIVLDESQSFKHQGTKRWKAMRKLRRLTQRMVQLTGTPTPNGYGDLWGQMYLLDHGQRLGATEEAFRDRWFESERMENNYTRWWMKPGADKAIQAAVADITITLRAEDYLDLPPVMYNRIMVDLPAAAREAYETFERDTLLELNSKTITGVNAAAAAGKLLQFANGAVYYDDKGNWEELHDVKLGALMDVLEDTWGPTLVAYGYKHDLSRLKDRLRKTKLRWAVLDTEESERRWNRGELDVLLLHPESAGHGLNLQHSGSETIVWFGLTANLEHYDQLNARLIGGHRRTGKNVVVHHILASDTRDEKMMELLARKGREQRDLIGALAV
jgi:SNF2 family DNA or RNA helicase